MKRIKKYLTNKELLGYIFLLFLSIPSIYYIFVPGLFPVHDDTQVLRVNQMALALSDLMIPVRWARDMGYWYGYPIFTFYGPLPYYIGGFFDLIGFSSVFAAKIMMGLGVILSGVFMYILAKEFFGRRVGIVVALLYLYAPYHGLNIFVRGAVGEYYAYAFMPVILWSVWKLFKTNKPIFLILSSISYALLIISHNLTALIFTPVLLLLFFILFFVNARSSRKRFVLEFGIFCALSLGLSAFYWMPAVLQINLTDVNSQITGGSVYSDHFVCLSQFWSGIWGFGGSGPGCIDGLSFRIGKIHIGLSLLSIIVFAITFAKKQLYYVTGFSILIFILGIFMSINVSKPIWDLVSPLSYIQFPWRYLSLIALSSSFISGFGVYTLFRKFKFLDKNNLSAMLFGFLIIFIFIFYFKLFMPQTINKVNDSFYLNDQKIFDTQKLSDEYLPKGFSVPDNFDKNDTQKYLDNPKIIINNFINKSNYIFISVTALETTEFTLRHLSYPGWRLLVDNKEIEPEPQDKGILLSLSKGKSEIQLKYVGTQVENIANLISLISLFMIIAGIIFIKKKHYD